MCLEILTEKEKWRVDESPVIEYAKYVEKVKGLIPDVTDKEASASANYLMDMGEVGMSSSSMLVMKLST